MPQRPSCVLTRIDLSLQEMWRCWTRPGFGDLVEQYLERAREAAAGLERTIERSLEQWWL